MQTVGGEKRPGTLENVRPGPGLWAWSSLSSSGRTPLSLTAVCAQRRAHAVKALRRKRPETPIGWPQRTAAGTAPYTRQRRRAWALTTTWASTTGSSRKRSETSSNPRGLASHPPTRKGPLRERGLERNSSGAVGACEGGPNTVRGGCVWSVDRGARTRSGGEVFTLQASYSPYEPFIPNR